MPSLLQNEGGYFKDRRVGLIIFGVLQALLGLLCLGLSGLIFVVIATNDFGDNNVNLAMASIMPGLLVYAFGAAWFITMGVGSAFTRRWARDLVLMTSWMWLIFGGMAFVIMVIMLPGMFQQMATQNPMPPFVIGFMLFFMGIIYAAIPGALVAFYRSPHVRATCRYYDPKPRWTERVPLPVLAVSFLCFLSLLWMPMMAANHFAVPVFGHIFTDAPGAALILICVLILLYVSWGYYHLDIRAWWVSIVWMGVASLSTIITFSRISWEEYYEKMGMPEQQVAMMRNMMPTIGTEMIIAGGLALVFYVGYLLYVRRFFVKTLA